MKLKYYYFVDGNVNMSFLLLLFCIVVICFNFGCM